MKLIFAGPTLHGAEISSNQHYELRPPASQGDFYQAVEDGANVIGLIDGVYEYVPAIWHKEILYGLSRGVHILGAASMGALRAAECHTFGMVGIGEIFEAYLGGRIEDDADVAQSHAPAEMGFLPLSEPLVNVEATISQCLALSLISPEEHDLLRLAAAEIFFKDRTYRLLVSRCIKDADRASSLLSILRANAVNPKLRDARLLIEAVIRTPDRRSAAPPGWTFEATSFWKSLFPAR